MLIRNATIVTPLGERVGDCLIRNGKIAALGVGISAENEPILEAQRNYLCAGFIDLQCNGGFGHDFTHDPSTIWKVARQLPQFGVTSFLPTIITSPLDIIDQARRVVEQVPSDFSRASQEEGFLTTAHPLGLHVEGPYLHPLKKGAHNAEHLRPPCVADAADWRPETGVRLVTLAPELPNADAVIRQLVQNGVIVSAGHSMATFEEASRAFEVGCLLYTSPSPRDGLLSRMPSSA